MTCRADKTALRNYVCVRVPSRFTLLALSSLLLSHGKMEHWLVYKNGAVKKKKRFRALSRYLEGNGDNSKFSILFSINVLSPSFFFYYCEKSQKFVLHLLSWKRVYIRVFLLDIQYNIRFIQFQNRFIVIPSATLQFRFHLFRITLPNDFLYFLHYVMFSIRFVSFH